MTTAEQSTKVSMVVSVDDPEMLDLAVGGEVAILNRSGRQIVLSIPQSRRGQRSRMAGRWPSSSSIWAQDGADGRGASRSQSPWPKT